MKEQGKLELLRKNSDFSQFLRKIRNFSKKIFEVINKETHQKSEKTRENESFVNAKLKKSKKFQKRY
jgi:hypothetical protein